MLVLDDFEPCIEEHLKRYQVYTTTVNDLATRQQALLKEIQASIHMPLVDQFANATAFPIQHTTQTFHEMCETSTGLHQRRMAHHDLITTYHHFLDIRKDISDRLKVSGVSG
jgi:GTP cyclohydrolase III